jgi:hypothetical protein
MTDFHRSSDLLIRNQQVAGSSPAGGSAGRGEAAPTASPLPPYETLFVAAARSANAELRLPQLPAHLAAELEAAETERCGDGSAMVVAASPWRWGGSRAGDLTGSLTLRRWGPDGDAWDLVCTVVVDPDRPERLHIDVVVRWSNEPRLADGLPPLGMWWGDASLLRRAEQEELYKDAAAARRRPPAFGLHPDADALPLRLDAGSLGVLEGELRVVASLGLAYVRATNEGSVQPGLAARTLRTAVADGRLAVPHFIRAWLDNGGGLLALEGPGEL